MYVIHYIHVNKYFGYINCNIINRMIIDCNVELFLRKSLLSQLLVLNPHSACSFSSVDASITQYLLFKNT